MKRAEGTSVLSCDKGTHRVWETLRYHCQKQRGTHLTLALLQEKIISDKDENLKNLSLQSISRPESNVVKLEKHW